MAAAESEDFVPKRNASSIIWNLFGFTSDDKEQKNITCKVCKESIKASDGNTTNLFNHLKRRHPKQYNESLVAKAKKPTAASAATGPSTKQQTLTDSFTKHTPYDKGSKWWNSVTEAVTFHLVKDLCPLRTVEGVGFNKMLNVLDPRYELPSRKYFSNTAIPRMYAECKEKVSQNIKNVQFFATTSDLWSSRTSEPYLSLTIHFISNWELCNATLQTAYFPEDHTSENIAAGLRECLEMWDLKEEKMTSMTTDSGSNMVKALDLNGWTRLQCFGHRLHLAIENGSRDPRIERVTSVCKKVVSTFSFSWKKKRALIEAQASMNLPQLKLKTESPTRWGSRLAMIERIYEQEKAISQVLKSDKKTKHVAPTWKDLDVMDSIKKALGPLREFTDALSAEDYVSVSYVKPVLHLLNNLLKPDNEESELTAQIKTTIYKYLTEKYQDPATDALLDMASLVDSRFKTQYINTTEKEQRLSRAVTELESLLTPESERPVPSTSTSQSQAPETQPAKKTRKSLASFLKTAAVPSTSAEAEEQPTLRELIERELQSYLSTPNVDGEMDPLAWWKAHEVNFPKLSQLARKYLCIPAKRSPSERVFSTGGNIVTCQMAALKLDKVDKLIFLAKNL